MGCLHLGRIIYGKNRGNRVGRGADPAHPLGNERGIDGHLPDEKILEPPVHVSGQFGIGYDFVPSSISNLTLRCPSILATGSTTVVAITYSFLLCIIKMLSFFMVWYQYYLSPG